MQIVSLEGEAVGKGRKPVVLMRVKEQAANIGNWGSIVLGSSGRWWRTHLQVFPPKR